MTPRQVATGLGFVEGPTLRSDGELIVVSIDQGRLYRLTNGGVAATLSLGGGPNGATVDARDQIFVAQNGGNWNLGGGGTLDSPAGVQRVADCSVVSYLTQVPQSPNDLCFGPDGCLYVTDPKRDGRYDFSRIWRVDVESGAAEVLVELPWYANGIAFGTDDELLVASTGERRIVRFDLDGACAVREETICVLTEWAPDGFALDIDGNIYIGALARGSLPGEVQVWSAEGALLERIYVGSERHYTNVALSSDGTMIVTASDEGAVVCIEGVAASGLALYPRRQVCRTSPQFGFSDS